MKIWASWVYVEYILVFLTLTMMSIISHLGLPVFAALFTKLARNSKTAYLRERNGQKFGPRGVCMHIDFFFNLKYQGHLGVIQCIFPREGCNPKMAHHGVKPMKIWSSGVYVVCIWVILTLNMSFWGHAVHFS